MKKKVFLTVNPKLATNFHCNLQLMPPAASPADSYVYASVVFLFLVAFVSVAFKLAFDISLLLSLLLL